MPTRCFAGLVLLLLLPGSEHHTVTWMLLAACFVQAVESPTLLLNAVSDPHMPYDWNEFVIHPCHSSAPAVVGAYSPDLHCALLLRHP